MAKMFLVTLSEANSNDIKAQEWALNKICNRVAPLGTVTLTTMYSTYDEILTLIQLLVQSYGANGGDDGVRLRAPSRPSWSRLRRN